MAKRKWNWEGTKNMCSSGNNGGFAYGLGVAGAAIYYVQQATTFWAGFVGVLKAVVWPAFLVYKLLGI